MLTETKLDLNSVPKSTPMATFWSLQNKVSWCYLLLGSLSNTQMNQLIKKIAFRPQFSQLIYASSLPPNFGCLS